MKTVSLRILFRGAILAVAPTSLFLGSYACSGDPDPASGVDASDLDSTRDAGRDVVPLESSSGCSGANPTLVFFGDVQDASDDADAADLPDVIDAGCNSALCLDPFPSDGGPLWGDYCTPYCGDFTWQCSLVDAGLASCMYSCPGGRRHARYREPKTLAGVGGYFARMHSLEAASVPAFERLARELEAHGAPARLVSAARRARRDEIRHVKITRALAARFSVHARAKRIPIGRVRSLESVALENAVEGCVLETFGALIATWQATRAQDPVVRSAMRKIARDETRHAELAFRVAAWADARLSTRARERVAEARNHAAKKVSSRFRQPSKAFATTLGLPSNEQARLLVDRVAPSIGLTI